MIKNNIPKYTTGLLVLLWVLGSGLAKAQFAQFNNPTVNTTGTEWCLCENTPNSANFSWTAAAVDGALNHFKRKKRAKEFAKQFQQDFKEEIEKEFGRKFEHWNFARRFFFKQWAKLLLGNTPSLLKNEVNKKAGTFDAVASQLKALEVRRNEIIGGNINNPSIGGFRIDGKLAIDIRSLTEADRIKGRLDKQYGELDSFLNPGKKSNMVEGVKNLRNVTEIACESMMEFFDRSAIRVYWGSVYSGSNLLRDYMIAWRSRNDCQFVPSPIVCTSFFSSWTSNGRVEKGDARKETVSAIRQSGAVGRHSPSPQSIEVMRQQSAFNIFSTKTKDYLDANPNVRQALEDYYKLHDYSGEAQATAKKILNTTLDTNVGSLAEEFSPGIYRTTNDIIVRRDDGRPNTVAGGIWDRYGQSLDYPGAFNMIRELQKDGHFGVQGAVGSALRGFMRDNGIDFPFIRKSLEKDFDKTLARYFEFEESTGNGEFVAAAFKDDLGRTTWDAGLRDWKSVFNHFIKTDAITARFDLNDSFRFSLARGVGFVDDLFAFLTRNAGNDKDKEEKEKAEEFAENAIRDFNEGREVDFDAFDFDPCASIAGTRAQDNGAFDKEIDKLKDKLGEDHEFGFQERFKGVGGGKLLQMSPSRDSQGNIISNQLDLNYNSNTKGWAHTHYKPRLVENGDGTFDRVGLAPMFSPVDVATFLNVIDQVNRSDNDIRRVYAAVVTEDGTFMLKFTGNQEDMNHNNAARQKLKREQAENLKLDADYLKYLKLGNELGFLRFLKFNMNLRGLELFQLKKEGIATKFKFKLDSNFLDLDEDDC